MNEHADSPLETALALYLRWKRSAPREPWEDWLRGHESLREWLEPLHDAEAETGAREPKQRLGEFDLVREIGRGGMGVVYEARHAATGKRVALKVLPAHLTLQE